MLVEAVEDLIDLGLVGDLRVLEMTALGNRVRRVVAGDLADVDCAGLRGGAGARPLLLRALGTGGELDVGLAQQRLLPQDRLRIREIGAYCGSISITARVASSSGASSMSFTLPTVTPPIRTSPSFARLIASGKSAEKR